ERRRAKLEAEARKAADRARKAAEKLQSRKGAGSADEGFHYEITVDERGVRIVPVPQAASAAASGPGAATDAAGAALS
ncbi:hypothetical protein ABTK69_19905, partial [Acinetobacter baumannii]